MNTKRAYCDRCKIWIGKPGLGSHWRSKRHVANGGTPPIQTRIDSSGRLVGHRYCACGHTEGAHAIGEPRRCCMTVRGKKFKGDPCACEGYRYALTGGDETQAQAPAEDDHLLPGERITPAEWEAAGRVLRGGKWDGP